MKCYSLIFWTWQNWFSNSFTVRCNSCGRQNFSRKIWQSKNKWDFWLIMSTQATHYRWPGPLILSGRCKKVAINHRSCQVTATGNHRDEQRRGWHIVITKTYDLYQPWTTVDCAKDEIVRTHVGVRLLALWKRVLPCKTISKYKRKEVEVGTWGSWMRSIPFLSSGYYT